jgi:hypothetical protein
LTCLPPGSNPSPPGGTGAPDPNTPIGPEPDDPDPEDEVDEDDLICALDSDDPDAGGEDGGYDEGWSNTTTVTLGGGTTIRHDYLHYTLYHNPEDYDYCHPH